MKGIGFLVGSYSITPLRLELIHNAGFRVAELYYFKVSKWFGIQCFMILRKGVSGNAKISYSRKVYEVSNHIKIDKKQTKLV